MMRYRCARVVGRRTQCRFEQYRHLSALWAARPAGLAGYPRGALPDFGSFSRGELNARRGLVHASPGLQDSWCGIFGAPVFTTFSRLKWAAYPKATADDDSESDDNSITLDQMRENAMLPPAKRHRS